MNDLISEREVHVDPELRAFIRPLSADEQEALESDILERGCLDPLKVWDGTLIDGHHRYEICQKHNLPYKTMEVFFLDRQECELWMLRNQLGRRNLSDVQRYRIGEQIRERVATEAKARQRAGLLQGNESRGADISPTGDEGKTNEKIAKEVKLSRDKVQKLKKVESVEPGLLDAIEEGAESVNSAYKKATKKEKAKERAAERAATAELLESITLDERVQVVHADFRDALSDIAENSVDLVLTDPPYPAEYIPLYSELGYMASQCLKPGGVLAVMVGQSYLPALISRLSDHLTYHWTFAYMTPGAHTQLWQRKVMTGWKPVLIFTKGDYVGDWLYDIAKSKDDDKRFHHWGQSESGTSDLMERLSKPGDMVLDPFVGGGTTAVVAALTYRRFLGCDLDEEAIETTTYRLKEIAQMQKAS